MRGRHIVSPSLGGSTTPRHDGYSSQRKIAHSPSTNASTGIDGPLDQRTCTRTSRLDGYLSQRTSNSTAPPYIEGHCDQRTFTSTTHNFSPTTNVSRSDGSNTPKHDGFSGQSTLNSTTKIDGLSGQHTLPATTDTKHRSRTIHPANQPSNATDAKTQPDLNETTHLRVQQKVLMVVASLQL